MCDYEMPAVYAEEKRKARKEHKCFECRKIINKGDTYYHHSGCWDGSFSHYKYCERCNKDRHDLADDDGCLPPFGMLADYKAG